MGRVGCALGDLDGRSGVGVCGVYFPNNMLNLKWNLIFYNLILQYNRSGDGVYGQNRDER